MTEPTVTLSALTLTEPWASLCASGAKTLETRVGPVLNRFTGPLVIHASKGRPDLTYLRIHGFPEPERPEGWPADLRGMALGVVWVGATFQTMSAPRSDDYVDLQQRACYHDLEGRFLTELSGATWFPAPIPAWGFQCRWQITVPRAYLPEWAIPKESP